MNIKYEIIGQQEANIMEIPIHFGSHEIIQKHWEKKSTQ